ncbi:MAG TPA: hypothetical protein VGB92_10050 [Longimicrobium sp.]|jgi:hypothetical protein
MFIYLDHAHIVALDVLLRREPKKFAEFLEFWLDHKCKLVISRAHLHEIGQSDDDDDVQKRLDLLQYFTIWSAPTNENVDWVLIREIRYQTLQRLLNKGDHSAAAYRAVRDELYRPVEHHAVRQFVLEARPGWLNELRERRDLAQYENQSRILRKKYREITGRKEPKWNPEASKMLPVMQSLMPVLSGDEVADRWMAQVNARSSHCWASSKGKRQALVCIYDLDGLAALSRAPEQDLSRLGFYRALARHWVAPYCRLAKHDPEAVEAALDMFDPYDAPGISAALAVERGRKRQETEYKASDFMDVDHVLWAAYADLAFVDKRTYGFLAQAKKKPETAKLLSPHLNVRFERAASLTEVKRHIIALVEDRAPATPAG